MLAAPDVVMFDERSTDAASEEPILEIQTLRCHSVPDFRNSNQQY
jgi:hypothetical protein